MKKTEEMQKYLSFFKQQLKDELLYFWMERCLDKENGGYLNCFTNDGRRLVSKDKYTWSQGRFLWMFSRLAGIRSDMFDTSERERFLEYARCGRDFLLKHALVADDDYRCVFLTDAEGNPKSVSPYEGYDLSISADCFVVMGFAAYSALTEDRESFDFAFRLTESVLERYYSGSFRSLPYPVPDGYLSHARPMILTNLLCELYRAAVKLSPDKTEWIKVRLAECHREVFEIFSCGEGLVREFVTDNTEWQKQLFCQHINPGHTLEDMWFQLEAGEILGVDSYTETVLKTVKHTMALGWDKEHGGLFHFIPCSGKWDGIEVGSTEDNPQLRLVLDDYGSKLWWVHSEALYTTLLCYVKTGDEEFFGLFKQVLDYTFRTFPNPDRAVREWIQIRTRDGKPQDKVVALPVKDPYHIVRNVLLIIELLESCLTTA